MKTLFLVDGSHYDRLRSVLETPFDLRRLAALANAGASVDQAIYYRDLRDENEVERQRSLLGWLGRNGFVVKGRIHGPGEPRERYATNLVQIAVDALLYAKTGDHVMVLAGGSKLEPLFAALRAQDVKVTLISTLDAPDKIVPAPALIEASHTFIDLRVMIGKLALEKAGAKSSD
jgi:uncharacterized LabA/DUF88 family protein